VRTAFPSAVPEGRLNIAHDASPGFDLEGRPVPQGRLEIGRDAIMENLQPSLRDLIVLHGELRTNVLGSVQPGLSKLDFSLGRGVNAKQAAGKSVSARRARV
jgi:hypothetical protein